MRRTVKSLLFTVTIAASAPAPLPAAPTPMVVSDSIYRLVSSFGPETLLVRQLVFRLPVLAAEIDSSTGTLVVSIGITREAPDEHSPDSRSLFREQLPAHRILAYDLRQRQVTWDAVEKAVPIFAGRARVLLAAGEHKLKLVRISDGRELAEIGGAAYSWRDGVSLRVTDRGVCRWDPESGDDLWSADREVSGYVDNIVREDSVAYLIADGIQRLDLERGSLWSYSLPSSRNVMGEWAIGMASHPLILDSDLYFAADTTVVRLHSGLGAMRWRQVLPRIQARSLNQRALGGPPTPTVLGHLLVRDAGANVLVASLGWANGPKNLWIVDPPSLALLTKDKGRVLARVQVPGVKFLNDVWSNSRLHYVVSEDRVLALDDQLNVRATFLPPLGLQPLGSFIELSDRIIVTTNSGIAALSVDSLKLVWSHPCGRLLTMERSLDWTGARYVMTTQGLLRLDAGSGLRPTAYYPLRGAWARFEASGVLIGAGPKLWMVTLPEPKQIVRHQD